MTDYILVHYWGLHVYIVIPLHFKIQATDSFGMLYPLCYHKVASAIINRGIISNKTDLQALDLSRTYCHKTSTGPPSFAKPRNYISPSIVVQHSVTGLLFIKKSCIVILIPTTKFFFTLDHIFAEEKYHYLLCSTSKSPLMTNVLVKATWLMDHISHSKAC